MQKKFVEIAIFHGFIKKKNFRATLERRRHDRYLLSTPWNSLKIDNHLQNPIKM